MQEGRKGRLHPAVGYARNLLADSLNELLGAGAVTASGKVARGGMKNQGDRPDDVEQLPLVLVGCSGGPDSLALAAITAHFARRGSVRVGAVVVNHQMQEESAEIAVRAAKQCEQLGLSPVLIKEVTVDATSEGPEMAARTARYGAFEEAVQQTGAQAVLLAHTLDDQAETVLLGLARGSGTRSLAGMPARRTHRGVTYLRPLLALRRAEVQDICEAEHLDPWQDPTNSDEALMRAKVRHTVLPFLEEQLGGDVAVSLARTAAISGPDSEYLEAQAHQALNAVSLTPEQVGGTEKLELPILENRNLVILNRAAVLSLPKALQNRVLALAVKRAGGETPGFERLTALSTFVAAHGKAGPLQLAGHVQAFRRRPAARLKTSHGERNLKQTGVIAFLGKQ